MTIKQLTMATRTGRVTGNPPTPNMAYLKSTYNANSLPYELFIAWKESALRLNQNMKLDSLQRLKMLIEQRKLAQATIVWQRLTQKQFPHFKYCIERMTSLKSQAALERAKQLFLEPKNTTPLPQLEQEQIRELTLSIGHIKGSQRLMKLLLEELQLPDKMR